ncbi:hypothetical protein DTO271D3_1121 [Paecilomyces variotii]|nr:hypothetical protein DTO271D3_1121 [Paecilomyces variotii]
MYRQDEKLYIIMEYIPGHRLSDIWPSLSETGKLSIANHLREIFDKLRALPSPETFGGVLGGPLPHRYFFSYEKDPHITGPFNTEDDVYRALVFKSKKNWDMCARRAYVAELFDRHRQDMLSGHNSVFTHADFQRKNILVRERYDSSSSIDGSDSKRSFEVAAVLDWEFAGWYPSHWEYSRCFTYFDWSDDWLEKVERILNPCVTQAALMSVIQAAVLDANNMVGRNVTRFVDVDPSFEGHRWCEPGVKEPDSSHTSTAFSLSGWPDVLEGDTISTTSDDSADLSVLEASGSLPLPDGNTCNTTLGVDPDPVEVYWCDLASAVASDPDGDIAKLVALANTALANGDFTTQDVSWLLPTRRIKTFHPRSIGMALYRDAILAVKQQFEYGY